MVAGERGDLGEVGDRDDLRGLRQPGESPRFALARPLVAICQASERWKAVDSGATTAMSAMRPRKNS